MVLLLHLQLCFGSHDSGYMEGVGYILIYTVLKTKGTEVTYTNEGGWRTFLYALPDLPEICLK